MEDLWGNTITITDDGTTRTYVRTEDGMTISYPSNYESVDHVALNSFNGQEPG